MSYILDALKKSEAERNRGSVPTLLTIPSAGVLKSSAAMWAVLIALVINAVALVVWLYRPAPTDPQLPPVSIAPAPQPTPEPVTRTDIPTSPVAAPAAKPEPPAQIEAVRPAPDTEPAVGRFDFSTHVYAEDPTLRAVTVDGQRYVEGDTIDTGVQLKEITETGVVLEIEGRSVAMDVLQDWR
jgi:general secretion pathway protein B